MVIMATRALGLAAVGMLFAPGVAMAEMALPAAGAGEILVTAQRRAENLQSVPIAVTVADGRALADAQVDNIADIRNISASTDFQLANFPAASANILIRGLGTVGQSRSFEGSVGVFIDGVYRTRAAAALQNFLDIDNLQILRGPQATLFGKNTNAGAILLTSVAPSVQDYSGSVDLGLGNYGTVLARATVNLPLGGNAALRLAGLASSADSYFRNPTTGQRYRGDSATAVKGQLLWQPTDALSLRLIGDYARTDSNCCYFSVDLVDGPAEPIIDALTIANGGVVPPRNQLAFSRTLNTEGQGVIEDAGGTLLIDLDTGGGQLKSVTALRHYSVDQRDMDGDLSGADVERYAERLSSRFISQELTFSTRIQPLAADLLLGAYFSDEKLRMGQGLYWGAQGQAFWDQVLAPGLVYAPQGIWSDAVMAGSARSYAGFAHLDVALSEHFAIFAGARYSIEKKRGSFYHDYYQPAANDVLRFLGSMPGPAYAQGTTDRALSGTLGLQYRPTADVMLYASYNRGFKAGGVNIDGNAAGGVANNPAEVAGATPLDSRYQPETIDAFELGAKIDYFGGRARSNLALFHYDLSGVQIAQFQGLQFVVLNARSATNTGVEIENLFEVLPGVLLRLDGSWLPHAKYGDDPRLDPVLRGARFRFAPKFQGNAELNLRQPLGRGVNLLGRLQYQFSSSQFVNTASDTRRGAVGLWNANLGVALPDTGLQIEAWGRNLGNSRYITQAFNTPVQLGDENAYLGAPRTFGVRLRADF